MTRKTYEDNIVYLFEVPYQTINGEGEHIGKPCIFIRFQGCTVGCKWCDAMGTWPEKRGDLKLGIAMTNKEVCDYIDQHFPATVRVWITGGEPTEHGYEAYSLVKYIKKNSITRRIFHLITAGKKYDEKMLYEFDKITIDIKPPSSGATTPEEFISWSMENPVLKGKVDFKMVVAPTAEDITFARNNIHRLQQFGRDITVQPLYWSEAEARTNKDLYSKENKLKMFEERFATPKGWDSYAQFAEEFLGTVKYPNVRVLPQLHKIYWPGKLSGI